MAPRNAAGTAGVVRSRGNLHGAALEESAHGDYVKISCREAAAGQTAAMQRERGAIPVGRCSVRQRGTTASTANRAAQLAGWTRKRRHDNSVYTHQMENGQESALVRLVSSPKHGRVSPGHIARRAVQSGPAETAPQQKTIAPAGSIRLCRIHGDCDTTQTRYHQKLQRTVRLSPSIHHSRDQG